MATETIEVRVRWRWTARGHLVRLLLWLGLPRLARIAVGQPPKAERLIKYDAIAR